MTTIASTRKEKILLILKDRPSIIRSTFFHGSIRLVSTIAGWVCMVLATGLIIASFLGINFLHSVDPGNQEIKAEILIAIELICGVLLLVLALAFLFLSHLCSAIMIRNDYIVSLEDLG